MRARSWTIPSGVFGPASTTVNASSSARRGVDALQAVHEPVDRAHGQLVVGELGGEGHDPSCTRVVDPGGNTLVSVRARSLEPMVAVREDDRRGGDGFGHLADSTWIRQREKPVGDALLVLAVGDQRNPVRNEPRRQPLGEREHPDRVEVRSRRLQERQPVALRRRHGPLVGQDAHRRRIAPGGRKAERPDDAVRPAVPAVLVLEQHLVEVEARGVVDDERALAVPFVEALGCDLVAVPAVLAVAGEDQPDGVARVGRLEGRPAVVIDDVVRWRRDRTDVRGRALLTERVADPAEGKELGHGAVRFRDEGRPLVEIVAYGSAATAERNSRETKDRDMEPTAYDAFQEGCRLLANASPHAAVVALERARDLEPDKGSIRETLGRAYFRTGRFAAARTEFSRAVEIDPVNDYALFALGLSLLRVGDRSGARRPLKLAVAMRPEMDAYRDALSAAE